MSLTGRPATILTAAITALLLVLSVVSVVSVVNAGPAAAHAQLVSSNPEDGATLATMPEQVEFAFNEDINANVGAQIVIAGSDNQNRAIEPVTVEGPRVRAQIPEDLRQGQVTARYRVVSADGHPVAGEIRFTVGSAQGASPGAPANDVSNGSAPGADNDPNADEAADIDAASSSADAPNVAPYALMALAALIMVAFGAFLLRSERRRR